MDWKYEVGSSRIARFRAALFSVLLLGISRVARPCVAVNGAVGREVAILAMVKECGGEVDG